MHKYIIQVFPNCHEHTYRRYNLLYSDILAIVTEENQNPLDAAKLLCKRIGGTNQLSGYLDVLEAGANRRGE
jgi:hypothetical protein